ncbi:tRNA A37 methylthiotransferase MiaB [Methanophagales archaeon]|nr:tRNA A37 methylthiotransferase MiaB [Methanophagales archaeon]
MNLTELSEATAKVSIVTFGCTANTGDTMEMRAILRDAGHEIVEESEADVVIVNTCTVTKRTELNVIRRLKALKERGKTVVVAGCMAAAQPELVKSIFGDDVAMVTPRDIRVSDEQRLEFDGVIAVITIAQGCVGKCSYCIVKQARGELKSYKPEKICGAVKSAVECGANEIRLTSQDSSAYGWDSSNIKLPALLEQITALEGDFRIRVGMMNPFTLMPILDELLEAFDSEKIFKFFHVPVQSGSGRVLTEMRRNYKVADFVEIVAGIRARFRDSTISTDFIIGFPTETEADFLASLNLMEELKPEKVNITRFSSRPGTEASKLTDLLEREKKRRSRIFSTVYHNIVLAKNKALEGVELPVLVTEPGKKGGVMARDSAYRAIVVNDDLPLGASYNVRVTEAKSTYLVADILQQQISFRTSPSVHAAHHPQRSH